MANNQTKTANFSMFGSRNLSAAVIDGALIIRVPLDKGAMAKASPSASGKNLTLASSGGLVPLAIEGLPPGMRVNLSVTIPPAADTLTGKV